MSEGKTETSQNPNEVGSAKSILDNPQVFQLLMRTIDERVSAKVLADRMRAVSLAL